MITVNQLTVRFNGVELFRNLTCLITATDKVGLVGKNGAGKSTFLKVLLRKISADEGSISYPSDLKIGYLPQQLISSSTLTVFDEAMTAFSDLHTMKTEIDKINMQIAERTDYESDEYSKLIQRLTDLSEQYSMFGGGSMVGDAERTLIGLGFKRSDFSRSLSEFSGGWKMRVELAKILLQKPALLLLDEPTNHLDIESVQWLEDYLKEYSGALILISHDRAFLDAVTNRTLEISMGNLYDYKAPYSRFMELRKERRAQQLAAYENQQKMIEDTEKFIERFRYQATKAIQVQSRIKQLEKLERIEIDDEDTSSIAFTFPPAPHSGQIVVRAQNLTKAFGEKVILENVDFEIERGEKVAFVGRNGEGKSTFSKVIIGELPYTGNLQIGHQVKIGYFAQNQDELLNMNYTVFETLDNIAVGEIRKKLRDILAAFLFRGEDIDKKVSVLSGGERNRLALAKLLLEPYNLLILDEPTNHLDIRSKDILKKALLAYDGTLILVSHDRDFLNGLTDKIYEFRDKKIKQHLCTVAEFLAKRKVENFREFENSKTPVAEKTVINESAKSQKNQTIVGKELYELKKNIDKDLRKLEKEVADLEKDISSLEKQIADLQQKMMNPQDEAIETIYKQHAEAENLLADKVAKWEAASEAFEKKQKEKEDLLA